MEFSVITAVGVLFCLVLLLLVVNSRARRIPGGGQPSNYQHGYQPPMNSGYPPPANSGYPPPANSGYHNPYPYQGANQSGGCLRAIALGGALQWGWILRVAGVAAPRRELLRLYLVGLFFNNFLPANVGGDAVKIFDLGRREGKPLKVFCGTLLDRLLGLTGLTALALAAVAAAALRTASLPPVYPLFVAMLIWLGLLCLLLSRRVSSRLVPLLGRIGLGRLAGRLDAVLAEFRLYRARARWFGAVFLLAVGVQALRVLTHVLAARGLSIPLTGEQGLQLFVLVPLLGILIALPISVNGIGWREGLLLVFLKPWSMTTEALLSSSALAYMVIYSFSLVGGIIYLFSNIKGVKGGQEKA